MMYRIHRHLHTHSHSSFTGTYSHTHVELCTQLHYTPAHSCTCSHSHIHTHSKYIHVRIPRTHSHTHTCAGGAVLSSMAPHPTQIPLHCARLLGAAPWGPSRAGTTQSHLLAFPKGKATSQSPCLHRARQFFLPATLSPLQNQASPVLTNGNVLTSQHSTGPRRARDAPRAALPIRAGRGYGGVSAWEMSARGFSLGAEASNPTLSDLGQVTKPLGASVHLSVKEGSHGSSLCEE